MRNGDNFQKLKKGGKNNKKYGSDHASKPKGFKHGRKRKQKDFE